MSTPKEEEEHRKHEKLWKEIRPRQLLAFEQECSRLSERYMAESAAPIAEATRSFDALLQHVYLFSCCFWGCHGKEHVFEHLAGRPISHTIPAHRLILTGYYDEALSLIRSVGEIANLLNLLFQLGGRPIDIVRRRDRHNRPPRLRILQYPN